LLLPNTGLLGIPAGLVKKIRDGNYIDLGDLLPEALEWAFERSTEDKSDKDKRKKFHISSVTDWVLAFATFMAVTVQFKPERAAALATYMTIVARLAREVPGQVWCRYDRLFRQAAAVNPSLPWDHRESDIWLAAMAENPRAGDLGSVTVPRTSARGEEVELCRRFNRGDCPSNTADIDTLVAYVVLVTTQRGIARYFRHRYHLLSALPLETADLVKCSAKTCTGLTHHNGPPELNCLLCCF
jgi:hypothetical protein